KNLPMPSIQQNLVP
ncbi:unnamed protein product, partial [Diplocarpon coronariae]